MISKTSPATRRKRLAFAEEIVADVRSDPSSWRADRPRVAEELQDLEEFSRWPAPSVRMGEVGDKGRRVPRRDPL